MLVNGIHILREMGDENMDDTHTCSRIVLSAVALKQAVSAAMKQSY